MALALLGLVPQGAALAYIDRAPTLVRTLRDATHVVVVEVERVDDPAQVITFKVVEELKGTGSPRQIKHLIKAGAGGEDPQAILDWADGGARAVFFFSGKNGCVCLGRSWYECVATGETTWQLTHVASERLVGFYGSVGRLRRAVVDLQAGRPATITVVAHGAGGVGAFFELGTQGAMYPGDVPTQRLRVTGQMSGNAWEMQRNKDAMLGAGTVGAEDVAELIAALQDPDPRTRAEAADELAAGKTAAEAGVAALGRLLTDADAGVAAHAGAALAQLNPKDSRGFATLEHTLTGKEATVRLAAARLAGNVGSGAAPLVVVLEKCLGDENVRVRRAAAGALGAVGPKAGAAVPALAGMLDDSHVRIAAIDGLGGIGPAAAAAAPKIATFLKDSDEPVQWAAARALARIGGPEARAAVPVVIELMGRSEKSYYNGTLLLATMGGQAKEALGFLAKRNDDLSSFARWAIDPGHLPGEFFRGSLGHEAMPFEGWWARAHLKAMGSVRRAEAVAGIARGLASGQFTAVEGWALELLQEQAKTSVELLAKGLKHQDAAVRKRMAETLGRMGASAAEAAAALTDATRDSDAGVAAAARTALKCVQGV